jgi:Phage phiEco32-like COOH.NH2 ligase-type 2
MIFAQERARLLELVINYNVKRDEFVEFAKKQSVAAPDMLLQKWCDNFYNIKPVAFSTKPRLINRFCVGADPEFVFLREGRYDNSANYGMTTLEAFGSDMTGRQAELRAYPSRSVLEVVASLLDTFRHMSVACPATLTAKWCAIAQLGNDGCGGHVHIGRKKPDMNKTISSLDELSNLLINLDVVDKVGSKVRKELTKYGKNGDIRIQPHGFEYRTMPTWLDSPWSAFLTLTLSKLAILHNLSDVKSPKTSIRAIENLLRTYANVDDDANIALQCFMRIGLPECSRVDFKGNWGITIPPSIPKFDRAKFYFPPIICPSLETCQQLFNYLIKGHSIGGFPTPKATWKPFLLDDKTHKISVPPHIPGLPEIAMGLLARGIQISIATTVSSYLEIVAPPSLNLERGLITQVAMKLGLRIVFHAASLKVEHLSIHIPTNIAQDYVVDTAKVDAIRSFLTKFGLFPIAKYEEIESVPLAQFFGVKKKEPQLLGSIVKELSGSVKDPLKVDKLFSQQEKLNKAIYTHPSMKLIFDDAGI